ncbi:hypothetical protein PSECIP111854_02937 [Pseudoalteromonas sp. CIP111854]|uniref:DUF3011 domain-containing protein n=1 Tax=Pseudoalteromonas holothuriae TaxID=2963714 RepID=A0A9W4R1G0_9GAMM|nr:hypothetical protein [Pseudoalteromonas sp. CIP111854]CAH9062060.1 hypothetical protein PSECIP111854_02937 [Pseudoalteromonas sp. CIP111854]
MKTIILTSLASMIVLGSVSVNALPHCPGGGGHWSYETQRVKVCDRETETYTTTHRDCDYYGHIYLGHLWNTPDIPLSPIRYTSFYTQVSESSACPSSKYMHESGTYWYTKPDGFRTIGWYDYTGTIANTRDQLITETHERVVETNCRYENKVVRVWRCGMEP